MKNKILYIGDDFWGIDLGTPDYVNRELLIEQTDRPWQFLINTSPKNTTDRLLKNIARDIIGHQPGNLVFMLGSEQLKNKAKASDIIEELKELLTEIKQTLKANVIICTLPSKLFESEPDLYNEYIKFNEWLHKSSEEFSFQIADFDKSVLEFSIKMNNHDFKFKRNLLNEKKQLNRLGFALLGKTIFKQIS